MLIEPAVNIIDRAVYRVPRAASLAAKGSWPNGRGWLHETESCVAAIHYWWDLEDFWKAKLGIDR